jgi:hypothetical protein
MQGWRGLKEAQNVIGVARDRYLAAKPAAAS